MLAKYFSCTFLLFKNATNLWLLGIMHADPSLAKSPFTSSYSSKKYLAEISVAYFTKWFTIYFYCWWVDDASFQFPLVSPCMLSGTLSTAKHRFSNSLSQHQSNSQTELSKPITSDFKISKRKRTRILPEYIPKY